MYDYEREHNEILRRRGAECAVLLKSDGSFPLDAPCELALYGSGARRTVKGGTGSGEVNSRFYVTAEDGLEAAGFTLSTKTWMDRYDEIRAEARKRFIKELKRAALKRGTLAVIDCMGAVMPEPEYDLPLDGTGDTAVYVLSRISGEGSDRQPVAGYILLTGTEIRQILRLEKQYARFLLVLNVGGPVDLTPVMSVKNVLLLSQLGGETGNILADILLGKSTPSGKLTTTWTAWEEYPAVGDFGDRYDTRYREGIYVGYRYFDSVGREPLFPFGYGLSYTSFEVTAGTVTEEAGRICVGVSVKNTGSRSGKEVVQLYVSQPEGRLDKPYQVLAAFAKTEELGPGEEQQLTLSFDLRDLASYDAERAAWILEAGEYILRLGTSSRDTKAAARVRLHGEAIIRQGKNCLGKPDFADWKPERQPAETPEGVPVLPVYAAVFQIENVDYALPEETDPLAASLSDEELCLLNIGAFGRKGAVSAVGEASSSVAGAAGETVRFAEKEIPGLIMADGPAGLRLSRQYTRDENGAHAVGETMPESVIELMPAPSAFFIRYFMSGGKVKGEIFEQYCSAIPIGTALAQSWNLAFAEQCGDLVGDEMERFGVHLWLAPALNIHRNIRCGRNFEYFSEDPLISGRFAAAVTNGVQKHPGCGTTVKHFAANNQETNRYGNNSLVSERAMREIYLKGFEIAVKESQPHALMTSYNLLNGVHTSERRDLTEDVLRAEFGFQGIVMTDWIIGALNFGKKKYAVPNAAKIAAAGGDLVMPGGKGDLKAMLKGLKDGSLSRRQLEINAARVIRMAKKLNGEAAVRRAAGKEENNA
ncbi:MAG: glycoside hydrolase family 3 C-terminal domain-containing protein [Lachnospiraceae bacterium]|nr:glycoside hydrolase family 3 C-terminal domain-containing protein [Lachnospiraceae bacterium]